MNVLRHLRPECISLDLDFLPTPPPEAVEETDAQRHKRLLRDKDRLLEAFAALLMHSGEVANQSKLFKDLDHRERKATTGIASGVAIPHVRSMQVKHFVMGFVRAPEPGWPFLSLDGEPTRFYFLLASPPWDDRMYLQVYRELAQVIQDETTMESLAVAEDVQAVMNAFRHYFVH
jgi:mannitol/fructose-specific phosphotransferase system IIA component (Ntr-type)